MKQPSLRIVTAMRHWSAAVKSDIISCEYCSAHATYTSSLVDSNDITQEVHYHCDPHGDEAIALLETRRHHDQHWVVAERHWMHIWKVGYKPCVSCRADSRFIATQLDSTGDVIVQELYCARHAPASTQALENTKGLNQIEFDLLFRFGGCYPVATDGETDESDRSNETHE
jgi:hypothetical protein